MKTYSIRRYENHWLKGEVSCGIHSNMSFNDAKNKLIELYGDLCEGDPCENIQDKRKEGEGIMYSFHHNIYRYDMVEDDHELFKDHSRIYEIHYLQNLFSKQKKILYKNLSIKMAYDKLLELYNSYYGKDNAVKSWYEAMDRDKFKSEGAMIGSFRVRSKYYFIKQK